MTDEDYWNRKVRNAYEAMDEANYRLTLAHVALLNFKADGDVERDGLASELAERRDEFVGAYNAHNALLPKNEP